MTEFRCPGCALPQDDPRDCDHCEYFNLLSGRTHYCGSDACYCRALRQTPILPQVLASFTDGKAAAAYQEAHQARVREERAS